MYHLINASIAIQTTKFYMYNQDYRRSDCTKSGKGGKRPSESKSHFDINPCFCHVNATCVDATTSKSTRFFDYFKAGWGYLLLLTATATVV
jgi:hypothetical protein